MNRILLKRTLREVKANAFRYGALCFLVFATMFLVVSTVGSAESHISTVRNAVRETNLEDGEFGTFTPLRDSEIKRLEAKGAQIEEMNYAEYELPDSSVLRIAKTRSHINKLHMISGEPAANASEIAVEKTYAAAHGLKPGDTLEVGGKKLTISGIAVTEDYDMCIRQITDTATDAEIFGTAFVTPELYAELLKSGNALQSESCRYAYTLGADLTHDDFKEELNDIMVDVDDVNDEYFREMADRATADKAKAEDAVNDLYDAAKELDSALDDMVSGSGDLDAGIQAFAEGLDQISAGAAQMINGPAQILAGIDALDENMAALESGAEQLSSAADALGDGGGALSTSIGELKGGIDSLNSGIAAFAQGLSGVKGNISSITDDPAAAAAIAAAIDQLSSEFSGIVGGSEQLSAAADAIVAGSSSLSGSLTEAQPGASNLASGASALRGGLGELRAGVEQMNASLAEFAGVLSGLGTTFAPIADGSRQLADGATELKDAGGKFVEASEELKAETDELLGKYFKTEIANLTDFLPAGDNPRIMASIKDSEGDLRMGILVGIIVLIVIVYVVSVFVVHSIEQDAPVIGTLYALGLTPTRLRNHYVVLPVLICLIGGVLGTLAGFSEFGFGLMGGGASRYFSMPDLVVSYAPYILVYGLVMPVVVAWLVNTLVLRKKLNQTALSLMRRESGERQKLGRVPKTKNFVRIFRSRQLSREKRSTAAIMAGIFVSLLVLALGFNSLTFCDNLRVNTENDTAFDSMYLYKYPTENVPAGGHAACVESLSHRSGGRSTDVAVLGLEEGNPFFPEIRSDSTDTLSVSSAVASKFGIRAGDEFTLADTVGNRIYGFRVSEIVDYDAGFYVFMDIDSMRKLFGHADDYFNAVFSSTELPIDAGRLYSVTTRDDLINSAAVFLGLMRSTCTVMIVVAIIVFLVVLYQMLRVMIDRSATPIALMKIFGYNNRLIRKLYLDGNFIIVLVATPFLILFSKWLMDLVFPSFMISTCGYDFSWPSWLYFAIYAGVVVLYLVIRQLIMRGLGRITPAIILKDRE